MNNLDDLVPVDGAVYLATEVGIFLDVRGGLFFVPVNSMAPAERGFAPGETVTLQVARSFAKREGLIE